MFVLDCIKYKHTLKLYGAGIAFSDILTQMMTTLRSSLSGERHYLAPSNACFRLR